jgi:hypothetical protein
MERQNTAKERRWRRQAKRDSLFQEVLPSDVKGSEGTNDSEEVPLGS